MADKTVVFILSAGHSGSTLLGHFLGAHPRAMHVGEISTPLDHGLPVRCYFCGERPCPVWGGAVSIAYLTRCWKGYRLSRLKTDSALVGGFLSMLGIAEPPGRLYARLFEAFPDKDVVVDSSKNASWASWNSRTARFRSVFALLVRDFRALVASRIRSHDDDVERATRKVIGIFETQRRFVETCPPANRLTIRYEDLASNPGAVAKEACRLLGLPESGEMLEFYRVPQHHFGGNPGPTIAARTHHGLPADDLVAMMEEGQRGYTRVNMEQPGFRLDDRWRRELTRDMLHAFEAIGGAANRALGYAD